MLVYARDRGMVALHSGGSDIQDYTGDEKDRGRNCFSVICIVLNAWAARVRTLPYVKCACARGGEGKGVGERERAG